MITLQRTGVFILLLINMSAFAQSIDEGDSTYMRVDYSDISNLIHWEQEGYDDIFYSDEIDTARGVPLCLQKTVFQNTEPITKVLFLLDTSSRNDAGDYLYTHNPAYFHFLQSVDATRERDTVGRIKLEQFSQPIQYRAFAQVLIRLGVVETYYHLYAELVETGTEETDSYFTIGYDCVFHYCTNDCFDPEYEFSMVFDKTNGYVYIQ